MIINKFMSLFSRKNTPEIKASCGVSTGGQQEVILQRGEFLEFAIGHGAGLTGYENLSHQRAMMFYQQSSAVATAVDIIAQEMSRIRPAIRNPDGSLDDSSPILDLLSNPNDWNETWGYFFGSLSRSFLLTGDSYTYASGIITRPPLELYAIKPQNINTTQGNNDLRPESFGIYNGDGPGNYSRSRTKTGFRFYDGNLRELWHTMAYSSTSSNFSGDSPLKAVCLDISSQIKGRLHNVKLLDNGARPSLLAVFKNTLTTDQHIERRELINEQLAGSDNAGKIASVSSDDLEIKELGINNKDMDYENLERIAEHAIYKRYRIPLPLISNDAATFNNMENAVGQLYDFAVLPRTDELLASLTMFLMPRYGLNPEEYQITYNPEEIEALKMRRVQILMKRKELGIESINELREGLPNRDDVEGGDDILVLANMIPIASVGIEPEEPGMSAEEEAESLANIGGD